MAMIPGFDSSFMPQNNDKQSQVGRPHRGVNASVFCLLVVVPEF